jgi:hypothetical protein
MHVGSVREYFVPPKPRRTFPINGNNLFVLHVIKACRPEEIALEATMNKQRIGPVEGRRS